MQPYVCNHTNYTLSCMIILLLFFFFFSSRRRHTRCSRDWSSDVCSSDLGFGISRVDPVIMDSISDVMKNVYGYDTGPYQGYVHHTDNDKFLAKLNWNINANNNVSFRWDYLKAKIDKPPHPFAFSFNNTGRGPNESSLPFYNAGYAINNHLRSFALELNS